jgi:methionyl-tRNA formyltransferase
MIIKNLKLLETKSAVRTKQDESKFIENWNKRTPEDGLIDWSNTSEEIHRLIRASTHPYPGAFTFFRKTKITIWKASIENDRIETGLISKISHNGVQIGTGDGSILLKLVSVDNEKETRSSLIFSSSDLGCKIGK